MLHTLAVPSTQLSSSHLLRGSTGGAGRLAAGMDPRNKGEGDSKSVSGGLSDERER